MLCQIAAVRARERWAMRVQTPAMVLPPWRSRSSWPLKVSKTDSMIWRSGLKKRCPGRGFSPLRAGRSKSMPGGVEVGFKGTAEVVLVTDHDLARWVGSQRVGQGGGLGEYLTFVGLGPGQGPAEWEAVHGGDQVQP